MTMKNEIVSSGEDVCQQSFRVQNENALYKRKCSSREIITTMENRREYLLYALISLL
jgi:hypothetical protein